MSDVARLAGETLCVGIPGDSLDEATCRAIAEIGPGAFVLFARNISSLARTRALVTSLHAGSSDASPPLVCIDQEGGRVARLRFAATAMPAMMALGATGDTTLARRAGSQLGADLRAIGATVNFAPVLDLALESRGTVIGNRALGDDPHAVAALGAALVAGLESAAIASAPKHFPGHGATALDSHGVLPTISSSEAELFARDLVPFVAAFAAGARAVMTAHVVVAALDPERPATLSRSILGTLLRERLDFRGVCFTDCLQMDAIARGVGTARGAALALAAGADCCVISHDLALARDARAAIVAAVADGSLPYDRLAEAASRVRALRESLAITGGGEGTRDDETIAREIAAGSITRVRGDVSLDADLPVTVISFEGAATDGVATIALDVPSLSLALRRRRMRSELLRVPLSPDRAMREMLGDVLAMQSQRNVVIVARRAHLFEAQRETIAEVLALAPHAVAISAREPFDIGILAGARGVLCSYGDEASSIEALADVLCGRALPVGTLPVAVASFAR